MRGVQVDKLHEVLHYLLPTVTKIKHTWVGELN